tara:strand:- start:409 stop:1113 length:705 start_codon:yes stop_codon:yes gene_type:complete
MKNLIKNFTFTLIILAFASLPAKAWIVDVWTIEGMDAQELSNATAEFKEKALEAGAKMSNIRSSSKIRGDNPQDTTFVHIYYETFEDMMHDIVLTAQQPDIFDSTYGQINQDANSNNAIFGNNKPMPEAGSAGQTVAYAFVEITSGINFLLNMPKFQDVMQAAGAKVVVDSMNCATCGESVLPANGMVYFAAANAADMGEAMDIFATEDIQRWVFANIAPHINITDAGILVFNN